MTCKYHLVYLLLAASGFTGCGKDSTVKSEVKPAIDVERPPDDLPPMTAAEDGRGLMLVDQNIFAGGAAEADGVWAFGSLFRALLSTPLDDQAASDLAENWLANWSGERAAKIKELILCPWRNASTGQSDCRSGKLDMKKAPFQLLAIVNRSDLRLNDSCNDAGEMRFVFGLKGAQASDAPFHVIFEYATPTQIFGVSGWANAWRNLAKVPCDDAVSCSGYRAFLARLTLLVTNAFGTNDRGIQIDLTGPSPRDDVSDEKVTSVAPEGPRPGEMEAKKIKRTVISNLRHLRTHERATGATEFREFILNTPPTGDTFAALTQTLAAAGGISTKIHPVKIEKCQACHTAAETTDGAVGERFNVGDPSVEAMGGVPSGIQDQLPGRREQLNLLLNSECGATGDFGGAQRSVPW